MYSNADLAKALKGFGVLFVLGLAGLYVVKLDVHRKREKIIATRARIAQAEAELTGEGSKIWYYTPEFREYRKKKELEEKQRKQQELEEKRQKSQQS